MRLRAVSVLGLILAVAGTCESTAPDTCIADRTYTIGTKADESMAAGDCDVEGNPTDKYHLVIASQSTVKFVVTGTGGANPTFSITKLDSTAAEKTVVMRDGIGKVVTVYAILVPGTYTIGVSAGDGPESGAYSIESQVVTAPAPVGCVTASTSPVSYLWAMRGVNVAGAVTATDCVNNSFLSDVYFIYMVAGKAYKITVASPDAGINVELNNNGTVLAHQNTANNAAGTVVLTYVPTTSMRVGVGVIGIPAQAKPTYTFKVE